MSQMKILPVCILFCLGFLGTVPCASAERPWTEVRSPHFRVLTNGDKLAARHLANEFEQMRYVFVSQFPQFRIQSGAPLTIFAARDEQTAKKLEPGIWKMKGSKPAGLFHHGWEKEYVMVRLDLTDASARSTVYHEYTHSVLHLNSHWLPLWLDEGMAEFYGYTRFEQHKIYIGSLTRNAGVLGDVPIPIETLLEVNFYSPYYHDDDKVQMFYAESWAAVHYMIFGAGMEHGAKLNRFFALLQQGIGQRKAFQQVFGDFSSFDKGLDLYMRSLAFYATVIHDPPQIEEKKFTTCTLTMAETEAELAGYHLAHHDSITARPLVEKALKDDPKLGLAHEEMGFLLFEDGEDDKAGEEFSQAYALDGKLYLSLFAKTMLSPLAVSAAPADEAAFESALMKVVDLNSAFAPGYVQLARLAVRQGKDERAFSLSRRAEELEPSRAGYHLLTGQILLRMGKDAEAAETAVYVAKRWYGPDRDEAVELWDSIPLAKRPPGETIAYERPAGTRAVGGIVKSVSCGGQGKPWTLVLNHDGKDLTFHTSGLFGFGFADTQWWGEDHVSTCRHFTGQRAVVTYRPAAGASYAGEVAEVDVRDDLPGKAADSSPTRVAARP